MFNKELVTYLHQYTNQVDYIAYCHHIRKKAFVLDLKKDLPILMKITHNHSFFTYATVCYVNQQTVVMPVK